MEMRDYEDIKKKLCKELEEVSKASKYDMAHIDIIDKIVHTIKNIDKIEDIEGSGYSGDGGWTAMGNYNRSGRMYRGDSYDDGNRQGTHYVRGHYSRATESFADDVRDMMNDPNMTSDERNTLSRALEILRK